MYNDVSTKEFLKYLEACDKSGVPVGWGDLVRKATELNLPIPERYIGDDGEMKIIWPIEN